MIFQPLSACSRSPWGRYMARITIMARRLEPGRWMICKNVRGLHPHITVLAVSKGVTGQPFHEVHFSHPATGILYEPECGLKF